MKWHHIGMVIWQPNNMCVVEAGGKKITLARKEGKLFAFAYKCPHASGIMADGVLDGAGNVVCPVHRYRFSLANGRNTSGEGYYLKTYAIEERPDGIYVGWEEKGLFGWL
jgi:nitrite reductase/ring-hydroxylating ferredoxin subunit